MQVVLVMFRSDGERRSFSVVRNMTVIGRREDCDLRIPVGDVSRKHCRILTGADGVSIEDLGSSNGTYVNHQRVQQSQLNAGDTIGVGPVQFVIQIDGVPEDDQLVPPSAPAAPTDEEDTAAGYQSAAIDDEIVGEDEVALEEAPLEEAGLEEDALAEAVEDDGELADEHELTEVVDEEPLGDEALEEEALEEEPLEEEVLGEDSVDELAEADEPVEAVDELEEASLDEEPVEDLEEAEDEELPEVDLEEAPILAEGEEAEPLAELEEVPPGGEALAESGPILEDELEELPLPPSTRAQEQIEELELDEDAPAEAATAEGSAWDFVIEESETERSPHELHIDLDAPHQQQPHGS
jgi:pSer/pThr/pTyr-binding forkhead associated (FHA) protein